MNLKDKSGYLYKSTDINTDMCVCRGGNYGTVSPDS